MQAFTAVENVDGQVMAAIWWGRPFQSVAVREKNEFMKVVVRARGGKTCRG